MPSFEIRGRAGPRWASVSIDGIYGFRGLGFFRLVLPLTAHVDRAEPTGAGDRLVSLGGDLTVGGAGLAGTMQVPHQLLPLSPAGYPHDASLDLRLDLDRSRIEAIEAARNGGDLNLTLQLWATLADATTGQPWQQSAQAQYLVNQGVWVRVLDEMGYQSTLLLEVPVPSMQASPELAAAANVLARAQQDMTRGDYRDAVGHCREVLEEIAKALHVVDDKATFENQRQKDKAQRLQLVRHAVLVLTHPAHHRDQVAADIEWSRIDAASVISITAALLTELDAPGARAASITSPL